MQFDFTDVANAWIKVALIRTGWDSRITPFRRHTFESLLLIASAD